MYLTSMVLLSMMTAAAHTIGPPPNDGDASVWSQPVRQAAVGRYIPARTPVLERTNTWDPPSNLVLPLSEVWNHTLSTYTDGVYGFKNYGWDQLIDANGSVRLCVRWDSKKVLNTTIRTALVSATERSYARWFSWLYGFDNFPYNKISVSITGWAANDSSFIENATTDDLTIYTDHDESGSPQCSSGCGRYFHQDGDYSNCPGGFDNHYDHTLWLSDDFEGGEGGDWGVRMGTEYFLSALNEEEVHVYEHEIGHIYGLDDFYDWRPTGETNFIMLAGSSVKVTEFDGGMLRNWWYKLSRNRGWQPMNMNSTGTTGASNTDMMETQTPNSTTLVPAVTVALSTLTKSVTNVRKSTPDLESTNTDFISTPVIKEAIVAIAEISSSTPESTPSLIIVTLSNSPVSSTAKEHSTSTDESLSTTTPYTSASEQKAVATESSTSIPTTMQTSIRHARVKTTILGTLAPTPAANVQSVEIQSVSGEENVIIDGSTVYLGRLNACSPDGQECPGDMQCRFVIGSYSLCV